MNTNFYLQPVPKGFIDEVNNIIFDYIIMHIQEYKTQKNDCNQSKAPVSQLVNADDTSVIEIKTQLYLES